MPTRKLPSHRVRPVPDRIRRRSGMDAADYSDLFVLETPRARDRTPGEWATAMFGEAPDRTGVFIFSGLLGLRITRDASPDHIGGWRIDESAEGWIRLGADNPGRLAAELVVGITPERVELSSFMRYLNPATGRRWQAFSVVHRSLAPGLMRSAARTLFS